MTFQIKNNLEYLIYVSKNRSIYSVCKIFSLLQECLVNLIGEI